jgi:DNA-binding response OmpR family regulator
MPEVLLVDDDPQVRELLTMYFEKESFGVRSAGNGAACLQAIAERAPDVVILDIMMPGMDGYEVCRAIRARSPVPVIFLTCRDEEGDPIIGLEVGADDYVTKPFNPREVVARAKAVLRRTQPAPSATQRISYGDLQLDNDTRDVRCGETLIELTPKEFDILWLLVSRPRVVFSREEIMRQVWGYDADSFDTRTVDTHVKHVRRKLEQGGCKVCRLETVWGVGYRLVAEDGGSG